ncbi:MAG: M56 family metallopeptidase [Lachnospiraceae bacterium]|nr:M56 family metallopeptidase [Lachnospiraceae bacterium]
MNLTESIIYVFYAFVLTTLSGSVFSLAWLLLRKCLGAGREVLLSRCLRVGLQFYLVPMLYIAVLWRRGDNMLLLPWQKDTGYHVSILSQSTMTFYLSIALLCIWGVGVTAAFIRYWRERPDLKDLLRCSEPERSQDVLDCFERIKQHLGIHRHIVLLRSCEGCVPCTVGILHKKVIVPARTPEFSRKELEVIFSHELMHCKRQDLFFRAEFAAANLIHALNPLVYRMRKYDNDYTEAACDQMACEAMEDAFSHKEYCSAILEMVVQKKDEEEEVALGITEKKSALQLRVETMLQYEGSGKMKKQIAALLTAVFVAGSSMTAYAAGNGVVMLHDGLYEATKSITSEDENDWGNTLEERVISAEEFATYGCIVMDDVNIGRAGSTINWGLSSAATGSVTPFHLDAGDVVSIQAWTDPEGMKIEAGVMRVGGSGVSVTSSDTIFHQFTISEAGDYYVFVKNHSSRRITVGGSYTY